jgi:hypothetical protein
MTAEFGYGIVAGIWRVVLVLLVGRALEDS